MSPAAEPPAPGGPADPTPAPDLSGRLRARSLELELEARNRLLEAVRQAAALADPEYDAEALRVLAEAWAHLAAPGGAAYRLSPPAAPGP